MAQKSCRREKKNEKKLRSSFILFFFVLSLDVKDARRETKDVVLVVCQLFTERPETLGEHLERSSDETEGDTIRSTRRDFPATERPTNSPLSGAHEDWRL